jgi:hypothetical protein
MNMASDTKSGGALSGGAASSKKKGSVPQNDREIAEATGVSSVGERVREAQNAKNVRRWKNPGNGLETIEGETVEQVRERVRREREESEPTEFQKSILGGPGPVVREPVRASE